MKPRAFVALYDSVADWEYGHLLVELHTGRFTGRPWQITTFSATGDPVTTMGGLRVVPDSALSDVDPADAGLLILPGGALWDEGRGAEFGDLARRFVDAGVLVAAICGATAGLARAGLLDDRAHTSAASEYLLATGYAGAARYVDARAVADRGVVTAGPQSPVQFARATLGALGLAPETVLDAYEGVFHDGDPSAYPALFGAQVA